MKNQKPIHHVDGLRVEVYNGDFGKAFRQFKKKVQNAGIIQEYRDRQFYEKPSERRQKDMNAAKRRNQKRINNTKP